MKSFYKEMYSSSGSDTEELDSSLSDIEDEPDELDCDFTPIWRKLREVLPEPRPAAPTSQEYPLLTDMVLNCSDIILRPNTVVIRMYSVELHEDVAPLPPILQNRH